MLNPSIKRNLILKEMGIIRYEKRPFSSNKKEKKSNLLLTENILTLLSIPYTELKKDEHTLLKNILKSVKINLKKKESFEIDSKSLLNFIKSNDVKYIIDFSSKFNINELKKTCTVVTTYSLAELITSNEGKKSLWIDLKNKFNV